MGSPSQPYPKRQPYFAHRYCRLLTKTCSAQEIGHVAFALCVTIAHLEDAKRYRGPVTFYNEQLMPLIGVMKWESLDRARRRADDAGWLHYEAGNRGQRLPGRYWVTIPDGLEDLDDAPCDESQYPAKGEWVESQSRFQYPAKGDREGKHSIPSPNPIDRASNDASAPTTEVKNKRTAKRFVKPALEEVKVYCQERKNQVDPQGWLDYYESNGWKVGRNAMRDWKAAVRTWERNGFSNSNSQAKSAEPLKYRG